jgi:hypothetical protein
MNRLREQKARPGTKTRAEGTKDCPDSAGFRALFLLFPLFRCFEGTAEQKYCLGGRAVPGFPSEARVLAVS